MVGVLTRWLALIVVTVGAGSARGERVAAAPPLPTIPPLIVGTSAANEPKSFVVTGTSDLLGLSGIGFVVAVQGQAQRVAVYDLADGTPLVIADERQALVYDLRNERIAWLTPARAWVRMDWDAKEEKPMRLDFGVGGNAIDPENLSGGDGWFRVDRFLAAPEAALVHDPAAPGRTFVSRRADGKAVRSVRADPADPTSFRFESVTGLKSPERTALAATAIGRDVPVDKTLGFPDVTRLAKSVRVFEPAEPPHRWLVDFFRESQGYLTKLALTGKFDEADLAKIVPGFDRVELCRKDAAFGAKYRAALAEQGITFKPEPPQGREGADRPER